MEQKAVCINGTLKKDDIVLSTIDSEYPCMVGRVNRVIPVWSPEHDRESQQDEVEVDFRQDYNDARAKQIEEVFSALAGTSKTLNECGLDKLTIASDCLIRISGADMELISFFIKDEKYATVFAYRTISSLYRQQGKNPELRPVRGQHYENKDGKYELTPFNIGWFHRWGCQSEETAGGMMVNTVAIVEMPNGVVRTINPNHMEFIVDDKQMS